MVDVRFARWSRVSDLSVEPWMNQPDHSHPTETKVQTFSSDPSSNVHFLFLGLSHHSFTGVWHWGWGSN